jgi:hypothetical protein
MYMVTFQNIQFASDNQTFIMRISEDNGSTFKSSNYLSVVDKSFYNGGTVGNEQLASVNYQILHLKFLMPLTIEVVLDIFILIHQLLLKDKPL